MVRDGGGTWHTVFSGRENLGRWVSAQVDLRAFVGQTIALRVGAFNNGTAGVSSLTVDQVELRICP
jgi:bacillopeptidase F (M6 metalloprotease family)